MPAFLLQLNATAGHTLQLAERGGELVVTLFRSPALVISLSVVALSNAVLVQTSRFCLG